MPGPSTISPLPYLSASRRIVALCASVLVLAAGAVLISSTPAAAAGEITIEKLVNDTTADSAPGPTVNSGAKVTFTYRVTVNDPDGLYDIQVLDSTGIVPNCDTNGDGRPDNSNVHQGPVKGGDSFTCTATQTAGAPGTSASSTGTARASDFFGTATFESSDAAHFTVRRATTVAPTSTAAPTTASPTTASPTTASPPTTATPATTGAAQFTAAEAASQTAAGEATPDGGSDESADTDGDGTTEETLSATATVDDSLLVESMINGEDADQAPGPALGRSETVRWTHLIVNIGQRPVSDVVVTDSLDSEIQCRLDGQASDPGDLAMPFSLAPGESALCQSPDPLQQSDGPTAVAALVTVEAQVDIDDSVVVSKSDPVHYQIIDDPDNEDGQSVPAELAFTDDGSGEDQPALRIPWILVPGLVAMVAGVFFLLGLVRRPDEV